MLLVSFIVPIYNVEAFIEKCVQSIITQDILDLEIILVDDGSTDTSGKIIDLLAESDERIIVIHKENQGVSSARNTGLKVAKGKYILFVDGDDYIESNYASEFVRLLESTKANVGLSYFYLIDDEKRHTSNDTMSIITGEKACEQLYINRTGVAVWNKIYLRRFLNDNNLCFEQDIWFAEGMTFNIECFSKCEKVAVMSKALYHQTTNANSAVRKFSLENWYCGRRAMEYQRTLIEGMNEKVINAWNYHYREYNYSILYGIIKSNNEELYKEEIKRCIKGLRKNVHYPMLVDIPKRAKFKSILISIAPLLFAKSCARKEITREKIAECNREHI